MLGEWIVFTLREGSHVNDWFINPSRRPPPGTGTSLKLLEAHFEDLEPGEEAYLRCVSIFGDEGDEDEGSLTLCSAFEQIQKLVSPKRTSTQSFSHFPPFPPIP